MDNNYDNKEEILGSVERITYHNVDNGFCVLRIKVKDHKDLVTVTGKIPNIVVGEYIKIIGNWHNDRNHGQQFKADIIKALPPNSIDAMEKYLGSGLIKGIGTHFAKKLIKIFGVDVFDVIEHKPQLLSTIGGIGRVRADSICRNWRGQKIVRDIMVFLQYHGVGTARATRIYKTYGDLAIEIVSENPYKLAEDIRGIGFVSADMIAKNIGIKADSIHRARAGINHILHDAASAKGHCGLPEEILIDNTKELLGISRELIIKAIEQELEIKSITRDIIANTTSIFLTTYYSWEKNIATILSALNQQSDPWNDVDESITIGLEDKLGITLADSQKAAIAQALQSKVMVITGGPGTGKTTLLNSILTILDGKKLNIRLCAPTGRAAKRLTETTGFESLTIHRLLEVNPTSNSFRYNKENPLNCDYLIIDEVSMVDVLLFNALLQALPKSAALLLVGDVDQLPPVGAGQVLRDIIDSNTITTVKLTEIFRQSATSNIIKNAHRVNEGQLPDLQTIKDSDFYFINAEPGGDIINKIITLVKERIPNKFGFHPINDIQLLSPMQRGSSGVKALNTELQKVLNPNYEVGFFKFGHYLAMHDKVMQTVNNYDKEIYNGDIGIVKNINASEQEMVINFDNRDVIYDYADLDQITLAYAITIHKSQGSEYPVVIIPLTMQSYMMLKRNLLYTGITRGKKLVILIGQKKAVELASYDKTGLERYSKLKEWLILINS